MTDHHLDQRLSPWPKSRRFGRSSVGGDGVYPRQFEIRHMCKSAYAPACTNGWFRRISPVKMTNEIDPSRVSTLPDETCSFVAVDFDTSRCSTMRGSFQTDDC
jgi:hypothetical protein